MTYKRFGNTYVVSIEKGEEIVESLKRFCQEENIKLGYITGIGASNKLVIGIFDTTEKVYRSTEITGEHEITSLTGNITTMKGETYLHIHATLANSEFEAIGGHLNSAVVSGVCEVFVQKVEGEVDREFDQDVGLNVLKL
ncbi:MAG: uncharacterized protein PWR01_1019 [Clostridiales bacterium]|nr:uncharacterized protein [Clostridiales bacterium]